MSEMIDRCRIAVIGVLQDSDLPVGTYIDSEKIVRAVLKVMREPTDAMCDAADWQQQSEVNQYQRAIDAVLREKVNA